MKLLVNDQEKEPGETVRTMQDLLCELGYRLPVFVVRLNESIVERADYATTRVAEGDRIDVFNLVDGG